MSTNLAEIPADKIFDVRPIPCSVKHGQIFDRWGSLAVGDYFVLKNDHDPVPLRYQFEFEFKNAYSWDYLEQGPEVFQVKIGKTAAVVFPDKKAFPECKH